MEETSAVFPLDEKGVGAAAKQQSVLEKEYICLFQIY
jgi:hypothetical protein